MIKYTIPQDWLKYDLSAIIAKLTDAKAAVYSLTEMPYQQDWIQALQYVQLKSEVGGTSKIEGADFTDEELETALAESEEDLVTRSQRQARAASKAYKWITVLPNDLPVDAGLVKEVHGRIVTGADDDHCEPGRIRPDDSNVFFGSPQHRGANGGRECKAAFTGLMRSVQTEFPEHDLLVQALALHYHFASIHPFLDGNGRTARALEALLLQRAGLRDALFIAMSNYYYDEKTEYLRTLNEVRAKGHDLTPFLKFGLTGIAIQCRRLFSMIRKQVSKALYRNVMFDLFDRLKTGKRRVLAKRQVQILKMLLDVERIDLDEMYARLRGFYGSLKDPYKAYIRDIVDLLNLKAVRAEEKAQRRYDILIRLEWPTEITETLFFEQVRKMPRAKPHSLSL